MFTHKSILLSLVVALLFSAVSCEDNFLRTVPRDDVNSGVYWQNEKDARQAVNHLYNYLFNPVDPIKWDAMADIGTPNGGFSPISVYQTSEQTSEHGYVAFAWNHSYEGIRACNELLANIDQVPSNNPQLIDRFKAEARFIRAYLYTHLVQFYGNVPLVEETITPKEARNLTRSSTGDIYNFINQELSDIAGDLPESYSGNNVGRVTRGAANALKARAMLYAGRYQESYQAAQQVMNSNQYSLYSSYEDLFSYAAENNEEVILDKQFIKDDEPHSLTNLIAPGSLPNVQGSDQQMVPSRNMADAFEMTDGNMPGNSPLWNPRDPYENRDPRLRYTLFVEGDTLPNGTIYNPTPGEGGADDITKGFGTTQTGYNVKKYVNATDVKTPTNSGLNFILIRYAEVLLTYAEAKIEAGQIDQSVYDAINAIRQRPDVDMPEIQTGKSQSELRQIVRHERLVELGFEGFRRWDIVRWGIASQVMSGPIMGMRYVENAQVQDWEFPDFKREWESADELFPLPQKELDLNPNLNQNPGY